MGAENNKASERQFPAGARETIGHFAGRSLCWPVSGLVDLTFESFPAFKERQWSEYKSWSFEKLYPLTVAGTAQVGIDPLDRTFLIPV